MAMPKRPTGRPGITILETDPGEAGGVCAQPAFGRPCDDTTTGAAALTVVTVAGDGCAITVVAVAGGGDIALRVVTVDGGSRVGSS